MCWSWKCKTKKSKNKQKNAAATADADPVSETNLTQTHKERIQASWYRCEQFGLDHGSRPDFATLPKGTLSDLIDQHRSLLETTRKRSTALLRKYSQQFGLYDCVGGSPRSCAEHMGTTAFW